MLPKISQTAVMLMALACAASLSSPSYSASDGGTNTTTPTCKKNKVWDKQKKKCVPIKKSSQLDDDNIYQAARDLAYNRRYEEAIAVLNLASNTSDPRILNYLGYSNRKLGRIEQGLIYYEAALKADPDYTLVMEYMGEAFLQLGLVDKAREQLAAIEERCGKDCREYAMLKAEIGRYTSQ